VPRVILLLLLLVGGLDSISVGTLHSIRNRVKQVSIHLLWLLVLLLRWLSITFSIGLLLHTELSLMPSICGVLRDLPSWSEFAPG
jgi:hypothetical protein